MNEEYNVCCQISKGNNHFMISPPCFLVWILHIGKSMKNNTQNKILSSMDFSWMGALTQRTEAEIFIFIFRLYIEMFWHSSNSSHVPCQVAWALMGFSHFRMVLRNNNRSTLHVKFIQKVAEHFKFASNQVFNWCLDGWLDHTCNLFLSSWSPGSKVKCFPNVINQEGDRKKLRKPW